MPDFGRWTANGGDPSLNDINRADKFLDALAAEQAPFATDRGDADLAFLLSGWRDEVRHVPMDHILTPSQAGAALVDATTTRRGPNRLSLAVVGSAAAAVLCLGGFGAAVFTAGPGDGLYGVRSMLFGDEKATRDDAVVLAAQTELAQVQQLVEQGQWDQAQSKLAALSATVQSVDRVEQKQELIEQWNALTYKVVEQDPAATLPPQGEPLPVLPESPLTLLPLPVIEESVTATTTAPGETTTEPGTSEPGTTSAEPTPSETSPGETTSPSETSPAETEEPSTTAPVTTTAPSTAPSTSTAPTTTAPTTTAAPSTSTTAPTTSASPTTTAAPTTAPTTTAPTTTTTVVQSSATAPQASTPAVPTRAPETGTPQAPAVEVEPVIEQPAPEESAPPVVTTTTVPSDGEE